MENNDKKITLNGKTLSVEEFENEKKRLSEKKVQIVQISENMYRTRLID